VRHLGDPSTAERVEVAYARGRRLHTVRAEHCILACWHAVIPRLCAELPAEQRRALTSATKLPLLYTNVVLRNWTAFAKLKTCSTYAPGSYHTFLNLDWPVNLGDYRSAQNPEQPIVVHLSKTPCHPGLPARDQHRMGRIELLNTPFEAMERATRDQLARTLSAGGFDPARDIAAIVVNRWPHGYSYEYNSLWDPFWLDGGPLPCELARRRFGRIAIANSDAAAYSYTDAAIDQAHRAVAEITGQGK
jgi:spermidine dehydrogenase